MIWFSGNGGIWSKAGFDFEDHFDLDGSMSL